MHRYRLLAGAVAALLALPALAQSTRQCRLDGFDVLQQARESGFQVSLIEGESGNCSLRNATFVVSAPSDGPAKCTYRIFEGPPLAEGWTLQRIALDYSSAQASATVSTRAPWVVRMNVPAGRTVLFTLKRVWLRGPDCDDWKIAFD